MDLHVKFTGLFLFVPRADMVHVLAPGTGHHGGGAHVTPHTVTLYYNGIATPLKMDNWLLDLTGVGGTGNTVTIPDFVAEVGRLSTRKVPADRFGTHPGDRVFSHVKLPPASRIVPGDIVRFRAEFTDNGASEPVRLTHELTWEVKNVNFPDTLKRHRLNGSVQEHELTDPIPVQNVITLEFEHLPPSPEPCPQVGDEAQHYQAYFKLVGGGARHHKILLNQLPPCAPLEEAAAHREDFGRTAFTCMLGQAPPE